MTQCRCRRNVYMLGVAFLCNFAAYMTLESMQSSLNRGIGTTALCLLYASLVVSSLFLPPLVVARLDCRKSLTFSILMFALYTLANFYPKSYTLTPAAILLGMGSSVMWSSAFYYIIQLSQRHAYETKRSVEEVTGEFFGKFTAISHFSILFGTIFMSVIFESLGNVGIPPITNATTDNGNATYQNIIINPAKDYILYNSSTIQTDLTSTVAPSVECGLYYKFADAKHDKDRGVSDMVMYVLLSCYLVFNLVAALLCLCLDEVKGTETAIMDEAVGLSVSLCSIDGSRAIAIKEANGETKLEESKKLSELTKNGDKANTEASTFKLLKSTIFLLVSDKAPFLLIAFNLHYGMVQGFARGVYNASWITCALGIKFVAYVTCMYAVVMIVCCYSFGKLLRYTTHVKIFLFTMSFEILIFVVLLLWKPNPSNPAEVWIFFAIPFGLGISHSSLSSQLASVYSRFFPDDKKSGTALQGVWNSMGSAIAYGLSGPLYPVHMIALVATTCIVGTVLYLIAETIKEKPYRKCKGKSCF